MKPTIGRIVIYNTTYGEREAMQEASRLTSGCNVQNKLPAIIVAVWSDTCVNLKVISDGHSRSDFWKTSASQGDQDGQWNWPVIGK